MSTTQNSARLDRRMVLRIPVNMGTFLDLVAKYSRLRKTDLWDRVLEAGMQQVFGITPKELQECPLTVPGSASVLATTDLKRLTDQLCGEPGHGD